MITVTAVRRDGYYSDFCSKGHAGYAGEGFDIVCAAVSALIITCANSIEAFTDDKPAVTEKDGYVRLVFSGFPSEKTRLLMDSLMLGLEQIRDCYGRKYLEIIVREG